VSFSVKSIFYTESLLLKICLYQYVNGNLNLPLTSEKKEPNKLGYLHEYYEENQLS